MFNHLVNAPRAIANSHDNPLLWNWFQTDPFGRVEPNNNPQGQGIYDFDMRLPGQVHDNETGLDHNNARDYAPEIGRFVQPDPKGITQGPSPYVYSGSNALINADASGLAYTASRRLDSPLNAPPFPSSGGWIPGLSGRTNVLSNEYSDRTIAFSHQQIFFEDNQSPSNIGFTEEGAIKQDGQYNLGFYRKDDNVHYDDCLMREAIVELPPTPPYHTLGYNCQDWVADVIEKYKQLLTSETSRSACGM